MTQSELDKQLLEGLTNTVSLLCQSIDPDYSHGPETVKLAEYAATTRRLAEELANGVFVGNRSFQVNKAREVLDHLGVKQRVNGGIIGEPWIDPQSAWSNSPNDRTEPPAK